MTTTPEEQQALESIQDFYHGIETGLTPLAIIQSATAPLRAHLERAQAEAGAMREALQVATTPRPEDRQKVLAALAPDAGKAFLERLTRAEDKAASLIPRGRPAPDSAGIESSERYKEIRSGWELSGMLERREDVKELFRAIDSLRAQAAKADDWNSMLAQDVADLLGKLEKAEAERDTAMDICGARGRRLNDAEKEREALESLLELTRGERDAAKDCSDFVELKRERDSLTSRLATAERERDNYKHEAEQCGDYILSLGKLLGSTCGDDTPEKLIAALQARIAQVESERDEATGKLNRAKAVI